MKRNYIKVVTLHNTRSGHETMDVELGGAEE
jgi:hypothetical protein